MSSIESRFSRALARFDEENAKDPRSIDTEEGPVPAELLYSRRMSGRLVLYDSSADEALRLAVHAQHLCRWRLARTQFPAGRAGYLEWRRRCGEMHADLAAGILRDVGYDEELVLDVAQLLRKERLDSDPRAQVLEDVACLVFLESYAEDFLARRRPDDRARILRRTWKKMSERARQTALEMPLDITLDDISGAARDEGEPR